ncbi:unnamed protein product [Ceratitis capitata]|uniref:(Mediterranean fruit fly) hypothetical protein n=1 Tax=Ceratitis capitata TaxID=7213 RepID=A0A811UXS7_CERCA|nr:unnamed protein product [Ceratitis capitata]
MSNKFLAAATIKRCHALYVEAFKDFRQFEIRIDMYMFVLYSCFQLLLLNYICIKLPHAELSKHQRHPTTTLQQFSLRPSHSSAHSFSLTLTRCVTHFSIFPFPIHLFTPLPVRIVLVDASSITQQTGCRLSTAPDELKLDG